METLYTIEGMEKLASIVRAAKGNRSARKFADLVGVSHSTIRAILRGERKNPDPLTLKRIAEYIHYDFDELMAIAQSGEKAQEIRQYRLADEVWPIVEALPEEEAAKLAKMIIERRWIQNKP